MALDRKLLANILDEETEQSNEDDSNCNPKAVTDHDIWLRISNSKARNCTQQHAEANHSPLLIHLANKVTALD